MPDDEETTGEDVRLDEVMGIDHSEQPGLGGDSSVLEEYGEDTDPTDAMAEKPEPAPQATLPGTDPDLPADLAIAEGGADPTLPQPGHELKPGIAQAADSPLKRPKDAKAAMDASGHAE